MHLYLAQITLHHVFLRAGSQPTRWSRVARAEELESRNACIQAAINAVKYISSHLEQDLSPAISWHSAYVILISTIVLFTAAISTTISGRKLIQSTIPTATLILSDTTYGSWRTKTGYLSFVQVIMILILVLRHYTFTACPSGARLLVHFLTCLADTVRNS